MPETQITFKELIGDPVFRKWNARVPPIRNFHNGPPYRVYLLEQSDGRWKRINFRQYRDAYRFVSQNLSAYDIALNTPGETFQPPILVSKEPKQVWKSVIVKATGEPKRIKKWVFERNYWRPLDLESLPSHRWCPHCRRPTVFNYFQRHHALPKNTCVNYHQRCAICGVRKSSIKDYWAIQTLKSLEKR